MEKSKAGFYLQNGDCTSNDPSNRPGLLWQWRPIKTRNIHFIVKLPYTHILRRSFLHLYIQRVRLSLPQQFFDFNYHLESRRWGRNWTQKRKKTCPFRTSLSEQVTASVWGTLMKPRGLCRYWSCPYLKSQGFRNPLVGVWYTGPLEIKEGWSSWIKADATLIGTFVAVSRRRVGGYELDPVRTYYGRFISQWLIFCGLIKQVQRWGWRERIQAINIPKPMGDSAPDIAYFF